MMNTEMKRNFDIDGLNYAIEFSEGKEFKFYVDVLESRYNPYVMSDFELGFGDEPPLEIMSKIDSKHVFRIKSEIMDFIDKALKRYKPHYFFYYANEDHKRSLYYKIGLYLAEKYGYNMVSDPELSKFGFYKVE